jgi:hypothetical protein
MCSIFHSQTENYSLQYRMVWVILVIVLLILLFCWYKKCKKARREAQIRAGIRLGMRRLWSDHIVYTRLYISARFWNDPIADEYAARLMKNQEALGCALGGPFGPRARERVIALLKEHINGAVAIVNDLLTGQDTSVDMAAWHKNASEIANTLSCINHRWNFRKIRDMMNMHLKRTAEEAIIMLDQARDYKRDTRNYDKVTDDAMRMADMLAIGLRA